MPPMSRHEFLERTAMAGAVYLVSSVEGLAIAQQKKVRVGVIGCGSVSNQYFPHLTKSPYVELVSACDIIYERATRQAAQYHVPHSYPHIDQMLAGPEFDLLVTLTDMQEHGRLNGQALRAGRHVWSEKPLANTYKEGRELLDLARSKNLRLWGAPAVVNSPQFAFMSRTIREGTLGRVSCAHAQYGHLGPTWSAFFYEEGGGSLPDLGVYNLSTLTGLLGPAKAVMAMTGIVTPERTVDNKGHIKVEAEDNAMVLMDHGDGVMSHVQSASTTSIRTATKARDSSSTPLPCGVPTGTWGWSATTGRRLVSTLRPAITRRRNASSPTPARMSGSRAPA